jgi:hypothetical protein
MGQDRQDGQRSRRKAASKKAIDKRLDRTRLAKLMNQTAITLAAGLIVAACSLADYEPPDIAIAEREAAEDAYNDCVWRSVASLDDGRSDPAGIAYQVQPMCVALYEKLTQTVVSRAKTQRGKDDARARYKDGELKAIASVVLIYRSRKQ